jgi:hypothetical protein
LGRNRGELTVLLAVFHHQDALPFSRRFGGTYHFCKRKVKYRQQNIKIGVSTMSVTLYEITTMERPYESGVYSQNKLTLTEKRFQDFLMSATIVTNVDEETGEKLGYSIVFNSGLRHTACRVVSIARAGEIIYTYDSAGKGILDKVLELRIQAAINTKFKKIA